MVQTASTRPGHKKFYRSLYFQVITAIIIGILLGLSLIHI